MATVGSIVVTIVSRTEKFVQGVTKAISANAKFRQSVLDTATKLTKYTAALSAAGTAVGAYFVRQQLQQVDAIGKAAAAIGISTDKLSAFQLAASEAGLASGALEKSLTKMVVNIGDAARGTGEAKDILAAIGLEPARLAALTADEQFLAIADALAKVENQTLRANYAYRIFGRQGTQLVAMLSLGRDGLLEVERAARAAGLVVTEEMVDGVERANDAIARLWSVLTGIARQITVRVAPVLEMVSKKLFDFFTADNAVERFADKVTRWMAEAIGMVVDLFHQARVQLKQLEVDMLRTASRVAAGPMGRFAGFTTDDAVALELQRGYAAADLRDLKGMGAPGLKVRDDLIATLDRFVKEMADLDRKREQKPPSVAGRPTAGLPTMAGLIATAIPYIQQMMPAKAVVDAVTPALTARLAEDVETYAAARRNMRGGDKQDRIAKATEGSRDLLGDAVGLLGKLVSGGGLAVAPIDGGA